jgi:hypothetical protein
MRAVLGTAAGATHVGGPLAETEGQMSGSLEWQGFIHISCFNVPRFVDPIALGQRCARSAAALKKPRPR